ncbi:MAG: hypothetical protein E7175_01390 [Erysipelotrichaceae bacterium]|nr:hypothetical protein [Erysipelotrichaceae bacterium]
MNRKTAIIGTVMSALMFASVAVGSVLALYQSNKTINVHLKAGSLSAKLYLVSIVRDEVDETGHWVADKDVDLSQYVGYDQDKGVDLSVYSDSIFDDILLIPGMKGKANFKLYNTGNIAFNYTVDAVNISGDQVLFDVLEISYPQTSSSLNKGDNASFSVSYLFEDKGVDEEGVGKNNNAMGKNVTFDISVLCTQVTNN